MASRTWSLLVDTTTAGGAVDLGNGNDQHAPIGLWSGYVYRYFAKYNVDLSGMSAISSATLHLRSTGQVHVGFGSSPTVRAHRLVAAFTGSGGSEGTWSGSANPKDSTQPAVTSSGTTTTDMTRSENTWDTLDVTAIAQAWLSGSPNYGIRLSVSSEASTADTWEAYAQASSYDSYITVVYTPTATDNPPTATAVAPLTGDVADLAYTAGSGWASPRPTVSWGFSDPDSGASQSAYQVIVYNDSAGSPGSTLYDSGQVSSAATSLQIPATFVEGSYYHWQVRVWDNTARVSSYTATERFRTRWGAAEYVGDLGATPSAWALVTLDTSGNVAVEYNSSTNTADPGAGLGTWVADIASVTKQRYVRYRVWLLPTGTTAPALNKIVFSYNTTVEPGPDNWTLSAHAVADTATQVYGVRSLRIDAAGSDERTYQLVTVLPNTLYQLSGRIRQSAIGTNPFLALGTAGTSGELVQAPGSPTVTDWVAVSVSWYSGSNTSVYVQCGASGTGSAWFDALKLEASDTVTPWMPSQVSDATALDSSGLKVDASAGGTLRLRGAQGGTADIVDLGDHGLRLNGFEIGSGTAFPSSALTAGDRFFRTDLGMEFYYDGTRWLSTTTFCASSGIEANTTTYATSFSASAQRTLMANLVPPAGSDVWIDKITMGIHISSGGTALGASHSWTMTFMAGTPLTPTTSIGSILINSGSSGVWRAASVAIGALLGLANPVVSMDLTKVGTPGSFNILAPFTVFYRIVAT